MDEAMKAKDPESCFEVREALGLPEGGCCIGCVDDEEYGPFIVEVCCNHRKAWDERNPPQRTETEGEGDE